MPPAKVVCEYFLNLLFNLLLTAKLKIPNTTIITNNISHQFLSLAITKSVPKMFPLSFYNIAHLIHDNLSLGWGVSKIIVIDVVPARPTLQPATLGLPRQSLPAHMAISVFGGSTGHFLNLIILPF
jgi:hypothetical protein